MRYWNIQIFVMETQKRKQRGGEEGEGKQQKKGYDENKTRITS